MPNRFGLLIVPFGLLLQAGEEGSVVGGLFSLVGPVSCSLGCIVIVLREWGGSLTLVNVLVSVSFDSSMAISMEVGLFVTG